MVYFLVFEDTDLQPPPEKTAHFSGCDLKPLTWGESLTSPTSAHATMFSVNIYLPSGTDCYIANWQITCFMMIKSTISMGHGFQLAVPSAVLGNS